jgi:predicted Zn-dependent protease
MRLLIALAIAIFAVIAYYGQSKDVNQITGERQRVAMGDENQEVVMGLQASPEMAAQFGGVDPDRDDCALVAEVGEELLKALDETLEPGGRVNPYRDNFHFTLLADPRTVNAFALPGGQVFITRALLRELKTKGQLAGVLGHEIGHVIERHSNQQMAKNQFFQGLAAAGGVAGGSEQSARMAQAAAQFAQMKYGREDEHEADTWGVRLCYLAGYDPRAMIGVMEILAEAARGQTPPEILSTHPNPAHRAEQIKALIAREFPNGLDQNLEP